MPPVHPRIYAHVCTVWIELYNSEYSELITVLEDESSKSRRSISVSSRLIDNQSIFRSAHATTATGAVRSQRRH